MPDPLVKALLRLAASHPDVVAAVKEEKERRFNSPEARRKRRERSLKAAATVRARRTAAEQLEAEREAREPKGPTCDAMDIIMDAQETLCIRPPHDGGDHEDIDGHVWPYED